MIHSKIPFHVIDAHLHCPVRSTGCICLQNRCQLHYHAADGVLTSGCSFISQQIWIKIFIALAIFSICIKIENLSIGKRSMYIHIPRWHAFDFGYMSSLIVTVWHRWRSGPVWRRFWCWMSEPLCWRCRHLENLQEIGYCIYISDLAMTSTIYTSVASSKVVKTCLVHSRGFSSLNSSPQIPLLPTSSCSISRTVRRDALVDLGGFPFWAAINTSRSSLHTTTVCYTISWWLCTWIQPYTHPIASCVLFLCLPVVWTIVNCWSRGIFLVAAIAASWWTKWFLHCSWVSAGGILVETPVILLDSVPLSLCWCVSGAMICCSGSEEMMITKRSGKSWARR